MSIPFPILDFLPSAAALEPRTVIRTDGSQREKSYEINEYRGKAEATTAHKSRSPPKPNVTPVM